MNIPDEIISKIIMYSFIVDNKRKNLLEDIRKCEMKKDLEFLYLAFWGEEECYNWLVNDILRWMNEDIASLEKITNKCKEIYKRKGVKIVSYEDIEIYEKNKESFKLWNIYSSFLSEKEYINLFNWMNCIAKTSFLEDVPLNFNFDLINII